MVKSLSGKGDQFGIDLVINTYILFLLFKKMYNKISFSWEGKAIPWKVPESQVSMGIFKTSPSFKYLLLYMEKYFGYKI